jgi:hypothetical protein
MANGGPADITIEYELPGSPGEYVDFTQHVLTFNGISIEAILEEVRSFGVAWDKHLPIGVGKMAAIVFGGLLSDEANGPEDLFGGRIPESPSTPLRRLRVTWFGSLTTTVYTALQKYDRIPDKQKITEYEVTLQPSDAPVEAP